MNFQDKYYWICLFILRKKGVPFIRVGFYIEDVQCVLNHAQIPLDKNIGYTTECNHDVIGLWKWLCEHKEISF